MTITPQECADKIKKARRICALSGAGVSTAAGIPDFRGPNGLYTTRSYDPDRVFDIDFFHRDPSEFFRFSRDLLEIVGKLEPTFTHRFLAELEACGKLTGIITQNIDPLHQLAGSEKVIPIHGNYATGHCLACGKKYGFAEMEKMIRTSPVPRCDCTGKGVVKPDVVFFGEAVYGMEDACRLATECDLFFVLGSSLTVYPAASLPQMARCEKIVVNRGGPEMSLSGGAFLADCDLDDFFLSVKSHLRENDFRAD
ncbi:MAG: RNA polymerase subunit sigma [Planctomycetes bacterium]|nr:RNA polymerase subunit sigma [Planctomycetota bacterium]